MKIERVYTRTAVTTRRSTSAREAAGLMRRFHVGALLVTEEGGALAGILTDRDLVLRVMAEGLDPGEVAVERIMASVVGAVPEDTDVYDALERMRGAGVRRLVVTRDGNAAGIVSLDDIAQGLGAELSTLAALMKSEIRREAEEYDAAGSR